MNAQSGERHWFISRDGKRYGPYTFEALVAAAAKGVIDGDTVVWRLGWVQWHPASRVPGLIAEQPPEPEPPPLLAESEAGDEHDDYDETPRDLDSDEALRLAEEQPPQRRAAREQERLEPVQKRAKPKRVPQPWREDKKSAAQPEAAPKIADEQPHDEGRANEGLANEGLANEGATDEGLADERGESEQPVANDTGRRDRSRLAAEVPSLDVSPGERPLSILEVRPERHRDAAFEKEDAQPRRGGTIKRMAIGFLVVLVLAGGGWGLYQTGLIARMWSSLPTRDQADSAQSSEPSQAQSPTVSAAAKADLPEVVATLPAVEALAAHDPTDFDNFTKRFKAIAVGAADDQLLSLARVALRKSVKRRLATASNDTLLEITETYLAYMKELNTANPESCVALSDENKGAKLTSNLAKDYPILFIRDMGVLERIANTDSNASVATLSAEQARPHLENVFKVLRGQPVQSDLLGRDKLTPADYQPYCQLVIAFYEAVLAMPNDDKANLLRFLYAVAASDADDDLPK